MIGRSIMFDEHLSTLFSFFQVLTMQMLLISTCEMWFRVKTNFMPKTMEFSSCNFLWFLLPWPFTTVQSLCLLMNTWVSKLMMCVTLEWWIFTDILCLLQISAGATMLTDVTFWGLLVPFFYRDKFGLALVCRQYYLCTTYYSYYAFVVLDIRGLNCSQH